MMNEIKNSKISVYIVEDYLLTRVTYKKALADNPNINITGDFETAEDCIEALEKQPADVILMDLGLPYMTGIEATKIIHNKYPNIKIIILTSHENDDEVLSSLASGAICSKPPTELVMAAKIIDTSPSKTPFSCLMRTGTVRIPGKSSTPLAK